MQTNSNSITYFEYYPHHMDTLTATIAIEPEALAVLTLAREEEDFLAFDSVVDGLEKESGEKAYFLYEATEEGKTLLKALATKGFIAARTSEGSYYFALPGFERVAREALLEIEKEVFAENVEF